MTAPAVTLIPTWWGCRCARPSSVASRLQWKQISHQLHNYAKRTACKDVKNKHKREEKTESNEKGDY